MKNATTKLVAALLALCLLFAFAACGGGGDEPEQPQQPDEPESGYTAEIEFSGAEMAISGSGASQSGNTLVISQPGTYRLSGTLADGSIVAEAGDVTLVLANAAITNTSGPAILFKNTGDNNAVTLEQSSENTLIDGGENEDYDAALFSAGGLVIDGTGKLNVVGNNEEGIAAEQSITILDGEIRVKASDDGLNASADGTGNITIAGGYLYVEAGGDGLDSNGTIDIVGGTVISLGSMNDMSGGLDADGTITIAPGATVIAAGASNSNVTLEDGARGLLVDFGETIESGSLVCITQGSIRFMAFSPAQAFSQLIYIDDTLEDDADYEVYVGGEMEGDSQDGLYYQNAVYSSIGRLTDTVTTESLKNMSGPGGGSAPPAGELPPAIQPRQ